jgi:D-lactate dehydrogenase
LELANKYNLIVSNVPSYSPNSIAEFAVTQAINDSAIEFGEYDGTFDTIKLYLFANSKSYVSNPALRHFNQIQTKVREHDFRWEPTILSKSIKDLKVAVIGTGRIGRLGNGSYATTSL